MKIFSPSYRPFLVGKDKISVRTSFIRSTDIPVCATVEEGFCSALFGRLCLRVLVFVVFLIGLQGVIFSQNRSGSPFRLGLTGGYSLNMHTANFAEFAGYPVFSPRSAVMPGPPNFQTGSGNSLILGALFEIPLATRLSLTAKAQYLGFDGLLLSQMPTLLGDSRGNVIDAMLEYRINARLATFGAELGVKWYPLAESGLFLQAGANGGFLFQAQFRQAEHLLENGSGGLIDGGFDPMTFSRVRNEQTAVIPNHAPLQFGAVASLGYEIPLGFMRLVPEIGYGLPLSSIFGNGSAGTDPWRVSRIFAGFSAIMTFRQGNDGVVKISDESFDSLLESGTPPQANNNAVIAVKQSTTSENTTDFGTASKEIERNKAALALDIVPNGIIKVSRRISQKRENISPSEKEERVIEEKQEESVILAKQEVIVRNNYSLLPYIFFDGERSATLPQRYARLSTSETASFQPEKLRASTTLSSAQHPYYHLLNIIGYRMRQMPETKLNILGGIDGGVGERDIVRLGRQRALTVANYLRSVWGIDSVRLVLGEAKLTARASRALNEQDRLAENRRVELSSDTTALLEPIQLFDTVRRPVLPRVRIATRVQGITFFNSWSMTLKQGERALKDWSGVGAIPEVFTWRAEEKDLPAIRPDIPFDFALTAETESKQSLRSPKKQLPVQPRIYRASDDEFCENVLIEKCNLILFDATKSSVVQTQALVLKAMNTRITAKSRVTVEGYMDKSDDEEANKRLSKTRAQSVAQSLKFLSRGAQLDLNGYGSQKNLYDEKLPEGRMYSRTVLVTIETPIGEDLQK